jgi:hypothetical protein
VLVSQTLLSLKELSCAVDDLIKEFNLGMIFVLLQVTRLAIITARFTLMHASCNDFGDDSKCLTCVYIYRVLRKTISGPHTFFNVIA